MFAKKWLKAAVAAMRSLRYARPATGCIAHRLKELSGNDEPWPIPWDQAEKCWLIDPPSLRQL
jgi:hypothetical protein